MKNRLYEVLNAHFGKEMICSTQPFDASLHDLRVIFDLVNKEVFKSKLPMCKLSFDVAYDVFGNFNPHDVKISLNKAKKTSFKQFCETMFHEMCHYHDFTFGPMSKMRVIEIRTIGRTQIVNHWYDAHGLYFHIQQMKIHKALNSKKFKLIPRQVLGLFGQLLTSLSHFM